MLLSAVSVLVVAQSSSEIPEGLMNNPVYIVKNNDIGISNIVGIQLHWVQLHVSALYTGHIEVVL